MRRSSDEILKGFCITEKAAKLSSELNQYIFDIFPDANKAEVARAVEEVFNVKVVRVNMVRHPRKRKSNRLRRGTYGWGVAVKRAVVSLAEGQKIEIV